MNTIESLPKDPLWQVRSLFKADPSPSKLDLIVGVYRDDSGVTPVMRAVRLAEIERASAGVSKAYGELSGNDAFNHHAARLALGDTSAQISRQMTFQTVGCTGALRLLAEFIATTNPGATVWMSRPGYVNHAPVIRAAGLAIAEFDWQGQHGRLDLDRVLSALAAAHSGDVLLLQGSCHNPTGIDPSPEDWAALAEHSQIHGLIPLVDISYLGLGDGLDADAMGLRIMAERVETLLIGQSFSKNMGLYSDRTGAVTVLHGHGEQAGQIRSVFELLARRSYSMPPEHGAAVVAMVLEDPALRQIWAQELAGMRGRIAMLRQALASSLGAHAAPDAFQDLAHHRGMFSILPMTRDELTRLRRDHSVYITDDGRINIAGLSHDQVDRLATAITASLSEHRE